ncbi:MAG: extracellular solute-binding protein [Anaerolineae bacterium]|nr:extracellular solute-binding protein [Anaerolineae bacterium]
MKQVVRTLGRLLAMALLVAGCGAGAAVSESQTAPPTATPGAQSVTLMVWDQFRRDTERAVVDQLNAEFEAAHPGVKIQRVVKSFDDLRVTVASALQDLNGPDVVQVNQGSDMRIAVQAGLLLSLTPYLPQYRWDERFSASILARNSFSGDGYQFGTGNLYGLSPTAEVVGVYYNKDKFRDLGLTVPRTFAEFEALLSKAREAGETPIEFGNRDPWPGIPVFSAIEHVLLPDRSWLDEFVYGQGSTSFDIPENLQAAAKLQQWVQSGYFTEGFHDIGYEDSWRRFARGEGLMMLTGSWLSADIVRTGGERFGFFLLPPPRQPGHWLAIGGVGVPFCIRNGTRHADLAAEYLDWMVSPRAGELWLAKGVLPAVPVHASRIPSGTLLGDVVSAYEAMSVTDGVGQYIDWAGPTLYDRLGAAIRNLMALEVSPEETVAAIQAEYARRH